MTAPPGDVLANGYVCVELLSRGEAFDVYDAWSADRHCRCVVKVLRAGPVPPDARRRLLLEGRLLTRLDHPHLLHGYEVRSDPPMAVSRTVCGATVAHLVDDGQRLGGGDLALLGGQLAAGLRYLHRSGYLHLDVKPSNVVIDAGRAVLIDYSLARRPGRVRAGTGTPRYLAPEQATGGTVGAAADVWGLSMTLFEAATGRHPFADAWATITGPTRPLPQEHLTAPPLRRLRRRIPGDLATVIDSGLRRPPDERPTLDDVLTVCDALTDVRLPGA